MIFPRPTNIVFILILSVIFKCEILLGLQPNLILNSDIESGSSSPSYWSTCIGSGNMNMTWSTSQKVSGSHSLCTVVSTAGTGDWRQLISGIDDNTHYRFRVHVRASNPGAQVELQWFSDTEYLGRDVFPTTVNNDWEEIKDNNIIPPANATKVYVLMRTYGVGTYYFDDPVFMRKDNDLHTIDGEFPIGLYAMPKNELVENGDVENYTLNSTELPAAWTTCTGSGSPTFSWDSSLKYSGERSLKITLPGVGVVDWRQLIDNINSNDSFCLRAQGYVTNPGSQIELQWFSDDAYLGRDVFSVGNINQWTEIYESGITPPSGAVRVWLLLRAYSAGSYNFDDLSFAREQTAEMKVAELKNAGFNLYLNNYLDEMAAAGGIYGIRYVNMADTASTANTVNSYESKTALRIWLGNDEPAWVLPTIPANTLVTGYNTIISEDDYFTTAPHLVWLNHATEIASNPSPSDCTALRPYSAAADIISMDIYPIGLDKEPSVVGDYTQILYDDVCTDDTGLQDKAIWMVLQNCSWSDLGRNSYGIEIQWFATSGLLRVDRFCSPSVNTWDSISAQNIVPPSGAVTAYILLRAYSEGSYYFDDVTFSENGTNLLVNSNFETQDGTSGYPDGWGKLVGTTGAAVQTWDTSTYNSSSHSVKTLQTSNGISDWRQSVSVDDSKTYSLTAYVKSSRDSQLPGPTWLQTRFMAYDAIINGARGLVYWGTLVIRSNSELWEDVKQLAGEINSLSSELASPLSFREVSVTSGSIEYLLLDTDSGLCLIAANKTANTVNNVTFQISGLALSQIEEHYASSPETIVNNSFTKDFSPYEVKIWQIY